MGPIVKLVLFALSLACIIAGAITLYIRSKEDPKETEKIANELYAGVTLIIIGILCTFSGVYRFFIK